jgi:hypothetical protein
MTDSASSVFEVPRTGHPRGLMRDDLSLPPPQPSSHAHAVTMQMSDAVTPRQPPAGQTGERMTLLLGLSLAIVLPPEAVIPPRDGGEPSIREEPLAVIGAEAIRLVLGRTAIAVGSGYIPLDKVDRRLGGLMVRLNAYRITEAPSALVLTGLVSDTGEPPSVGWRVTPRALWELAKEMLKQGGHGCEPVYGLGEDAFLTLRGDHTAQVAWIAGDRLASVTVTSLQADKLWVITSARALAERVGNQ